MVHETEHHNLKAFVNSDVTLRTALANHLQSSSTKLPLIIIHRLISLLDLGLDGALTVIILVCHSAILKLLPIYLTPLLDSSALPPASQVAGLFKRSAM